MKKGDADDGNPNGYQLCFVKDEDENQSTPIKKKKKSVAIIFRFFFWTEEKMKLLNYTITIFSVIFHLNFRIFEEN